MVKKEIRFCVYFLLILKHFFNASSIDVQCEPAEIGTNHSISCSSSVVKDSILWIKILNHNDHNMWQCFKNTTCLPFNPSFITLYNGKIEYINSVYTSTFFIYNIRQSTDIYRCSIDLKSAVDVCNPLECFSKPEGVKCNESLMINEQNTISIVCVLTKVYPAAKMLLSYSSLSKTVNCVNDTSSTVWSIKCLSDIPVADMKVGINFIDVLIYPDVTSGEKFGVKKQLYISLTFPTPSLGQDCLDILTTTQGYIKQGTPANCTCNVKTQGVPPGGVKWFYNNGTEVWSGSSSESAVLQVMFFGKETNQSYRCVGVSTLGKDNQEIELTIRNAYGPEQLYISTNDINSMYDICSPNKTINIICSLPRQSVAPEPSVTITVSDKESLVIKPSHNSNHYMYLSSYTPKTIGEINLKCEALNPVFKELGNSSALIVYIAGPPALPPILTIGQQSYWGQNDKTVESQKEGSNLEITCDVSGGFPNTYNMTVSCDGSYNTSSIASHVVKLYIEKVGRQLNGKQCVCKAEHVTSCYVNNTLSVILNITFPAEVNQFTANSNSSSLTVSNNSDVIFVCDTESNPPATVEITKTESIVANTGKVNFTKHVMCQDSGEYFCKANNSDFIQPNQAFLILYVKCSLQLRNTMENYKVFSAQNGRNAAVIFDVLGFPAPVSYSLFKNENEYKYSVSNSSSNSSVKSKYQFEYLLKILPYGSVSVTLFNLTEKDFTNYTLEINNGIDFGLKLCFALILGDNGEETSDNAVILPAAIGGAIAGFLIISALILILFKCKELRILKINNCLRRRQYSDNSVNEATVSSGTSTSQPANNHRYENIDMFQTYDRLQAVDEITSNYNQISVPAAYDFIDVSQINSSQQYEQVTIKESTTYQNLEWGSFTIFLKT